MRHLRTCKCDHSGPAVEGHTGFIARLEAGSATDKLGELWSVEYDLIEEGYTHQVK